MPVAAYSRVVARSPDIDFPCASGERLRGYLATPAAEGPWPGVVVLHEAFGLTPDIRDIADRFAGRGYLALAPDLYSWGTTARCLVSAFKSMLSGSGRAFDDIRAARDRLAATEGCNGRVGVIGFCQGGGFALLCAPRGMFDAASVNYGMPPRHAETVLAGSCPIVGSYGGRDISLRGKAAQLDRVLTDLGVEHDVKEYPDASHSFLNHHDGWHTVLDRVGGFGHHEQAAEDAWRRIFDFFDEHLATGPAAGPN
jgi:carboxymethylenebutenolidase